MSRKTPLKKFQQKIVNSTVRLFGECLDIIEKTKGTTLAASNRATAISKLGHILIEAPTGIGKTLIAGEAVERVSLDHKVIWFWFAPFSGVVNQTISALKEEHGGIRCRNLSKDRSPNDISSGDIFVTTWSSLAISNTDSRKARLDTETMVSVDGLLEVARTKGYSIGVVVDEAHHGFRGQTQAYKFYREVLDPELTILATATPKDKDVDEFEQKNNVELIRLSVSRSQGVATGLLKRGVKVGVFRTDQGFEEFINLRRTALAYGAKTHERIAESLNKYDLNLTPLMLVQVDAGPNSVKVTCDELKKIGFTDSQIRIHTSDEPDPELLSIANDESVEVLVFKMAVALGFNAPRAFTLVSLRSTVDRDWGIQIVGRIMRVHKNLQASKTLPAELQYGYVFMSDHDRQAGLTEAASRINSIKDEFTDVSQNIMIVDIGNQGLSVQQVADGQPTFLPPEIVNNSGLDLTITQGTNISGASTPTEQTSLDGFAFRMTMEQMGIPSGETNKTDEGVTEQSQNLPEIQRYDLRDDITFPKQFIAAITDPNQDRILEEVIAQLDLPKLLKYTLRENAEVHVEKTEIFEGIVDDPETIMEKLEDESIARNAQKTLILADRDGYLDPRDFQKRLEDELQKEYRHLGIKQANDAEAVRKGAERLVALYPKSIKKAIKTAMNKNLVTKPAEPIPSCIENDTVLQPSRRNIYGIIPADMNSWEKAFARELDNDEDGIVLWWHRNQVRKKWAVRIPVPGFDNYYPDFIVGLHSRQKGKGILLVETKERINDPDGLAQAKTQVSHPVYGNPMMLYWKDKEEWMIVEYDENKDQNISDRVFRPNIMKTY